MTSVSGPAWGLSFWGFNSQSWRAIASSPPRQVSSRSIRCPRHVAHRDTPSMGPQVVSALNLRTHTLHNMQHDTIWDCSNVRWMSSAACTPHHTTPHSSASVWAAQRGIVAVVHRREQLHRWVSWLFLPVLYTGLERQKQDGLPGMPCHPLGALSPLVSFLGQHIPSLLGCLPQYSSTLVRQYPVCSGSSPRSTGNSRC